MADNFYADTSSKAEDNLKYEDNKRMKQVETFAGLVDRKMNMGAAVDIDDLQLLSSEYMKLKEKGVDVSGLDTKINSIKKNYKINQKLKEKGKDPLQERLGKEKEA
tara:strand:+ start:43 stop:360 length:318 start_codon:yes stop_codon:yes gene_type:complete